MAFESAPAGAVLGTKPTSNSNEFFKRFKMVVNFFEQVGLSCKKMDKPNFTLGKAVIPSIKFIINVECFEHGLQLLDPVPYLKFFYSFSHLNYGILGNKENRLCS